MFPSLRPIRPVRLGRPGGAPLVRGLIVGGAVRAAVHRAGPGPGGGPADRLAAPAGPVEGGPVEGGPPTPEEVGAATAPLLAG
ncbi:hypothetical protein OG871_09035 [Kitasatospora sp. NBC_00374]|uniref:hypothetical protein n=1 Tax=Kitasatospora sp. NBC_00374 TaxID=2975964 RepID=UPI0030E3721C